MRNDISNPYITNKDVRFHLKSAHWKAGLASSSSVRLHTMSGPEGEFSSNRLFRITRGIGGASHKIYPQSSAVTPHATVHLVTLKSIAIRERLPMPSIMEATIHSVQSLRSYGPLYDLNHARKA